MKEIQNILSAYHQYKSEKGSRNLALATVVNVNGSSYRGPGAQMLITDQGEWFGCVSGGCLEGDVLRRAREVMSSGNPVQITYDTREMSDNPLAVGLGCNGIIDIFIEKIDPDKSLNAVEHFEYALQLQEASGSMLILESTHPEMMVGDRTYAYDSNTLESEVLKALCARIKDMKSSERLNLEIDGHSVTAFYQLLLPPLHVAIFGSGFDARPVTKLAKSLGWRVTVSDECIAHVAPVHFPDADSLVHCQKEYIRREVRLDPFTAGVIMSHSFPYDKEALRQVLAANVAYIGVLGPQARTEKILGELRNEGSLSESANPSNLHAPIGLDIGAETPDEIAISIVAEIKSVFSSRSGGFLKYRKGPIHTRDSRGDRAQKQMFIPGDEISRKSS